MGLHNIFRTLKFEGAAAGESVKSRDRESMGSDILARVSGGSEIPETITVTTSVFECHKFVDPRQIELTIEVLHSSKSFQIVPTPGQLDQAMQQTHEYAAIQIKEATGVKPFYGSD